MAAHFSPMEKASFWCQQHPLGLPLEQEGGQGSPRSLWLPCLGGQEAAWALLSLAASVQPCAPCAPSECAWCCSTADTGRAAPGKLLLWQTTGSAVSVWRTMPGSEVGVPCPALKAEPALAPWCHGRGAGCAGVSACWPVTHSLWQPVAQGGAGRGSRCPAPSPVLTSALRPQVCACWTGK